MMYFTADTTDLTLFSAQGGTAADLQVAANAALAAQFNNASPTAYLYGWSLTGSGDGSQWGMVFTKSPSQPTLGSLAYAFADNPPVPAAASFASSNPFSVFCAQGGTIAEATAALQAQFALSGAVRDIHVAGSSNGQQWLAAALIAG